MKPLLSVVTDIDILPNNFERFHPREVDYSADQSPIVSSHKSWIIALLFLAGPLKATSIVALATQGLIVIASDGVSVSDAPGGNIRPPVPSCKVRQYEKMIFAASGLVGDPNDPTEPTYIYRAAQEATRGQHHDAGVAIFSDRMKTVLPRLIAFWGPRAPRAYASWLSGKEPVMNAIFSSIEDGVSKITTSTFSIDATGNLLPPKVVPYRASVQDIIRVAAGHYKGMLGFWTARTSWQNLFLKDPTGFVKDLIKIEIDAADSEKRYDVGLPITVARITPSSIGYVPGYEGACK